MSVDLSVVVPTYNEAANVPRLLRRLAAAARGNGLQVQVVLVDDGSPDGTAAVAQSLAPSLAPALQLTVVQRGAKRGLASAILEGWDHADADAPVLGAMDADLSHPPELVPTLLEQLRAGDHQVAVASRNVAGGGVAGWGVGRTATSWGATMLARPLTWVRDPMSGFFLFERTLLQGAQLRPRGYKVLLELLVRTRPRSVIEVPFLFHDRAVGSSKLHAGLYLTYLRHVIGLYGVRWAVLRQVGAFAVVGGVGLLLNLAVLLALVHGAALSPLWAAGVAFGVAVTANFLLHRSWTFEPSAPGQRFVHGLAGQYARYVGGALAGLALNLLLLGWLLSGGWELVQSQLTAVGAATGLSFATARWWSFAVG